MLTGGHQVADIALVYPIQSVWTRFVPSHDWTHDARDASAIESIYRPAMDALYSARAISRSSTPARSRKPRLRRRAVAWRPVVARRRSARRRHASPASLGEACAIRPRGRRPGRAGQPAGQQRRGIPLATGRGSGPGDLRYTRRQALRKVEPGWRRGHLLARRVGRFLADGPP